MADKLVRGRYVLHDPALLPDGGVIEDGAVAVEGARVAALGSYDELRARYPEAAELGSDRHVVLPGLVNTHHHGQGLSSLQLGVADDYLERWLNGFWAGIRPLDVYLDTLYGDLELIRSGVTTVLHAGYSHDWSAFEAETWAALRAHEDSGLRLAYAVQARDRNSFVYEPDESFLASLPGALADRLRDVLAEIRSPTTDGWFDFLHEVCGRYASHPRITILISPTGPQWCSDDLLRRLRAAADDLATGLHMHCLESPYQRRFAFTEYGTSAVEHLHGLGFLGPDVSLAHAVWLTDREIELCAATGTSVCHNASSNLRLRVGILPAARLLDAGVNVSIGIDGMGLNDDDDMLQELRLVARLHALPRGLEHLPCPSAADVFRMATVNGARSTTIGAGIGTLAPGTQADVAVLDWAGVRGAFLDPRTPVVDAIVNRARALDVDTVLVGGEVLLENRRLLRVDENAVVRELAAAAEAEPEPRVRRLMDVMGELQPHVDRYFSGWEEPIFRPSYVVNSP